MSAKTKFILGALVIVGSFLLGFVPELRETWRLQAEIAETQAQLSQRQLQVRIDKLRNIAGRMVLEALQQNYGVAQDLSTQYFDGLTQFRGCSKQCRVSHVVSPAAATASACSVDAKIELSGLEAVPWAACCMECQERRKQQNPKGKSFGFGALTADSNGLEKLVFRSIRSV